VMKVGIQELLTEFLSKDDDVERRRAGTTGRAHLDSSNPPDQCEGRPSLLRNPD